MQPNIPNPPFNTNLSTSAKETELRIRNIFQWKKKRPPVVVFVVVLLLAVVCGSLVGFVPANGTAAQGMTVNLIENRQIVPETHLKLLNEETRRLVEEYNETTVELKAYYTGYATVRANSFSEDQLYSTSLKHVWGGHRALYYYFIEQVPVKALYPDACDRIRKDPYLNIFYEGGSGGVWAVLIHSDVLTSPEIAATVQEYFALIDELTVRLRES